MELKKVTPEMRAKLNAPLPEKAVTKHPTKTYLSSIKAIYVVERLNDVFGIGAWKSTVSKESVSEKGMVVVKLIFEIPEYGIYHESFGGNDNGGENSKNFDLGDAFKGATTDALTKICSFLEIGISVFKGEGNKPEQKQPEQKPKEKVKPTLTADKIEKVNAALQDGSTTMEFLEANYTLLPEIKSLLTPKN